MTNEKKVRTVNDKEKGVDFMAELKMNMAELKMDPGSMTLDLGSRIQNCCCCTSQGGNQGEFLQQLKRKAVRPTLKTIAKVPTPISEVRVSGL